MRLPRKAREAFGVLAESIGGWRRDNAPRLGAALAYYTLFSLTPLLIVAIAVAGAAFGAEAAQQRVLLELRGLVGEPGASAVRQMLESSRRAESGVLATVLAVATLFLGATGVFGELRGALNAIWNLPEAPSRSLPGLLRERLASFALVLAVGFLLLVSLLMSAVLSAARQWLAAGEVYSLLGAAVSFAITAALFALMFRFLPDARIPWRDIWPGAVLTAGLFAVGKHAIGLYLGRGSVSSVYGAAGSVVALVVWVYYAAQIFLFGAELTQAYARRKGGSGWPRKTPA